MKLFLSYSRDDKAWVNELYLALRDKAHHDVWLDRHIVPAQDWWNTILANIEASECFVYVLTPRSVESIYCRAELEYALALNKPVLPLMLKPCDYPPSLGQRSVQYEVITDDMSIMEALFYTGQGLAEVRIGLLQGRYGPPSPPPPRPDLPTPASEPEQVSEVFALAEEAAAENNIPLAEKLFQQVMDADPQGWGVEAAERLTEIRWERDRGRDYLAVVRMASNAATARGAQAAARAYMKKYGREYDPNRVLSSLTLWPPEIPEALPVHPLAGDPQAQWNTARLRQTLGSRLSLDEARSLAFDLKLEYEGVEKGELVRRIILTLEQRGQLEQLVGWLQTNRADIDIAPFKLDPTPGRTVSKPSAPSRSETPAPPGEPKPTSPSPQPAAAGQGSSFRAWMVVAAVLLVGSTWLVRQCVGQPASEPSTLLSTPTVRPTSRPAQPAQTQSPAAKAISPVTANAQWAPQFQSFDGVQMALVPPGCFTMGTQDAGSGGEGERPTARLCFDQPFWIDKTEVTQAQFKRLGGQAANAPRFAGDNRPVERITWFEARDFCVRRGARLPTEAEWEYAARGPDNLVYPWGNTFDGNKVVYSQNSNSQTADVGSRPAGASWVGALDMSGNVWEWVSSLYKSYPYEAKDGRESLDNDKETRVLRGGSWGSNYEYNLRAACRNGGYPAVEGSYYGFRCARSS